MKANSNIIPDTYIDLGNRGYFNYNISTKDVDGITSYSYDVVEIPTFNKAAIVEGLIREKYSISDEISLINNYNDNLYIEVYNEYQIDRKLSKIIADQGLNNINIINLQIGRQLTGDISNYLTYSRKYELLGIQSHDPELKSIGTKFAIRHYVNNIEDMQMLKIITFETDPSDYDTIISMFNLGYTLSDVANPIMARLDSEGLINERCEYAN